VGLVPISSDKHLDYARVVKAKLEAAGLRVELDERNDPMKAKIRDFAVQKIPFVLIMGDKEAASEAVSVRTRGKGDEGLVALTAFVERAKGLVASRGVELA
jgi:threonyl-tRNA synthetase